VIILPAAGAIGDRMTDRAGVEAEAVGRLTDGLEPSELRAILVQCLGGELSAAVAIVRMLSLSRDVPAVREVIDQVTHRAATLSRSHDFLVHDRADCLTQLFVDNEQECTEIVAMAVAGEQMPDEEGAGDASYWDAFSRHLRQRPPA
jgi:hypothetical protein